jgi:hypothetical protein
MRINGAPLTLITRAWRILTSTFFFTFWLLPAFLLRILNFTLHLLFNSNTHNKAGPFIINKVPLPHDLVDQAGRAGIHSTMEVHYSQIYHQTVFLNFSKGVFLG